MPYTPSAQEWRGRSPLTRSSPVSSIPPEISDSEKDEYRHRDRPRRPWVAFALGLVVPGLGHVYAGAPGKGALALLVSLFVLMPLVVLLQVLSSFSLATVVLAIPVLVALRWGVIATHGALCELRRSAPLQTPYRGLVYLLWFLLAGAASLYGARVVREAMPYRLFRVPTESMLPRLEVGDIVIADMRSNAAARIARGTIAVIVMPDGQPAMTFKRVIGLPGERISMERGRVLVGGKLLDEPYIDRWNIDAGSTFGPITVPDGHYFVLGDNRDNSRDSRSFGPVPASLVRGNASRIYWSMMPATGTSRLAEFRQLLKRVRWDRAGLSLSPSEPSSRHPRKKGG